MTVNKRWHRADVVFSPVALLVIVGVVLALIVLSAAVWS